MKKQHVLGFFDTLVCTPAFLFLCAMFLCGALAGGLTGLYAGEEDGAAQLTLLLSALPEQVGRSILCAVLWVALPVLCALLRPAALFLSALVAARGFVLALTAAVSVAQGGGLLLSLCLAGLPAVLSVPALLAACTLVWRGEEAGPRCALRSLRAPYLVCLLLAAASALLRAALAALRGGC